jgi:hypothetical protein
MAAIEAIVFVGSAGFAVVVVATVLVIIGVHHDERYLTLGGEPPTIFALLARCILRAHSTVRRDGRPELGGPEEEPPWYERPVGPTNPRGPDRRGPSRAKVDQPGSR